MLRATGHARMVRLGEDPRAARSLTLPDVAAHFRARGCRFAAAGQTTSGKLDGRSRCASRMFSKFSPAPEMRSSIERAGGRASRLSTYNSKLTLRYFAIYRTVDGYIHSSTPGRAQC